MSTFFLTATAQPETSNQPQSCHCPARQLHYDCLALAAKIRQEGTNTAAFHFMGVENREEQPSGVVITECENSELPICNQIAVSAELLRIPINAAEK